MRLLPPLGVRHLDFYLQHSDMPEDYKYYHRTAHASGANHMAHLTDAMNPGGGKPARRRLRWA